MRVLLDTNIILDVLLNREPWVTDAARLWRMCTDGRIDGYIAASSLTDIFYIARRLTDVTRARAAVRICLATFLTCPVDHGTLRVADGLSGDDFEDNLQIACAMAGNLDVIISRDQDGLHHSPIPVLTPVQFLQQFSTDANGQGAA